ncbi:CMP-N-acetylneuraminic acid synthetase, partial [Kaistia hirudinis]|nr:CMP-N-acetylneuraminic acid synthetase [Kaistia hirudinis]
MSYKLVALMPMRHSSERVKGKNYRPFGDGRPLF